MSDSSSGEPLAGGEREPLEMTLNDMHLEHYTKKELYDFKLMMRKFDDAANISIEAIDRIELDKKKLLK